MTSGCVAKLPMYPAEHDAEACEALREDLCALLHEVQWQIKNIVHEECLQRIEGVAMKAASDTKALEVALRTQLGSRTQGVSATATTKSLRLNEVLTVEENMKESTHGTKKTLATAESHVTSRAEWTTFNEVPRTARVDPAAPRLIGSELVLPRESDVRESELWLSLQQGVPDFDKVSECGPRVNDTTTGSRGVGSAASSCVSHAATKKARLRSAYHAQPSDHPLSTRLFVAMGSLCRRRGDDWTRRRLGFDCLLRFVTGSCFTCTFSFMIIVNTVTICVNTNHEINQAFEVYHNKGSTDDHVSNFFRATDIGFTAIFTVELLLRLCALEITFFTMDDARWNVMDLLLVAASVCEMTAISMDVDLTYVRILRLIRIFRALRVVRTVPMFMKLRIMVNAIANSILSLFWALGLLVFAMLMFGACFLQGATQYVTQGPQDENFLRNVEHLEVFFSSLPMAILTLYMSITGGVDWWDVAKVMMDVGVLYGVLFAVYVAIMFFALLNIVTGIFVNDAIEMTQLDREVVMKFEQAKRKQTMQSLKGVFEQLTCGSGTVTKKDFIASFEKPEIAGLLTYLGVEVSDSVGLFDALDVDGSKGLDLEEFVMGCMQLRGQAKTVDMVTLMRDNKRVVQNLKRSTDRQEAQLAKLLQQLELFAMSSCVRADDIAVRVHAEPEERTEEPDSSGALPPWHRLFGSLGRVAL